MRGRLGALVLSKSGNHHAGGVDVRLDEVRSTVLYSTVLDWTGLYWTVLDCTRRHIIENSRQPHAHSYLALANRALARVCDELAVTCGWMRGWHWPHGPMAPWPHAARQGQGAASRTRATLAQSRKVEAFERSLKDCPSIFIGATEALGNEVDLSFN
jgi:hypothetical protein